MKRLLTLLALTAFLCSWGVAQEKSQLAEAMGQIQSSFEALKKDIENNALDQDNVLQIDLLIDAAGKAASLDPPGADRMQGEQREHYVKGYRSALESMIVDAEKLRDMVKSQAPADDRYDQLMKVYSHQKRGHDTFQRRSSE